MARTCPNRLAGVEVGGLSIWSGRTAGAGRTCSTERFPQPSLVSVPTPDGDSVRSVPRNLLVLSLVFAVACGVLEPDPVADDDDATEALVDDDDATEAPTPPADYAGPAYLECVTEAQCDPGSACTTVPGHGGLYCAPACDPLGDGSECQLQGKAFDTMCLDNGRCARTCLDEDPCPETVGCVEVEAVEEQLCAGEESGGAGFYGVCTHPNIPGPDCPPETECLGGAFVGTDDAGVCLPWCDDGSCPTPPAGTVNVNTLCYDIGFEHPLCVLICQPTGGSVCPMLEFCLDTGFGVGICAPDGAEVPDDIPL